MTQQAAVQIFYQMIEPVRMVYDRLGFFALLALVYLGGGLLWSLIRPVRDFYLSILVKF
jgi:hypothetical protein